MFYEDSPLYKEYLPDVWQNYVEISDLDGAIKIEMKKLIDYVKKNINNKTIENADETGVRRWEKLLSVSSPLNSTLAARKDSLQAKLMTNPPININTLKSVVEAYMGLEVEITVQDFTVTIKYRGTSRIADLKPLFATAYELIPANLIMQIMYAFLTWEETDSQNITWDETDAKNLTWNDWERGEWIA